MAAPHRATVRQVLHRLEPELSDIVLTAWRDWLESPEAARILYPRTRACFVWDRMIAHALARLPLLGGVRPVEQNDTVSFLVDEQVLFRFKKGNASGMSSNYPTQLALAFHDHEQQLFGMPEISRVDLVYVLNQFETRVEQVLVVARERGRKLWQYDIMNEAALESPIALTVAASAPVAALVRARGSEAAVPSLAEEL